MQAPAAYLETFNDSVRLMASFNWLNHARKDNARSSVKDSSFSELCGWDTPVGKENLWPFDVRKKCDELKKTKKLGAPAFKGKPKFPKKKSNYRRQYKKPFLGKNAKGKKKQ